MVVGPLLARGRDADVFEFGPGRVLRRYRRGGDTAHEAEVMRHVAAHGFPVPAVFSAEGPDLVMERLHGPTLLRLMERGEINPDTVGVQLADLHRRLHVVPALNVPSPGRTVLHLDLHPDNVMLTVRGPVVVDWRNATDASPERDVAQTAVILAQVSAEAEHALASSARASLTAYVDRIGELSAASIDAALAYRSADPAVTPHERALLGRAGVLLHGANRPRPSC